MFPSNIPGLTSEANDDDYQFIGDSSCVSAAKFKNGDLSIQFQDGTSYTYHGVSPLVWANFLRVLSKGWFLNKYIRNNYSFTED